MAAVVVALAGLAGAGVADAAVVTGRVANAVGGCLENAGGVTTPGNPVRLVACGSGVAQQWSRYADGTLRVQGRCADLKNGTTAADTAVVMNTCSTSTSQRWTVRSDGRLLNQRAGRCLQPYRGYVAAGMPATIATCSSARVQQWAVPALSTVPTAAPRPTTPTTTPRPTTPTPPATTPPAPVPTAPVPTAPAPTSAVATPPWASAFTTAGLTGFRSTPWNNVGAAAPVLVRSPTRPGEAALEFTVPGGGNRSEVEPSVPMFVEGTDGWFGLTVTLPPSFPTRTSTWQLITQWKNQGTGSPPLEVTVGKGNLWISGGYGHPAGPRSFAVPISAADTGRPIDLVFHVVFSRDPARGRVDVWRDGVPAITGYRPAGGTLYPTSASPVPTGSLASYWKTGLYRDPAITEPGRYVIESARQGPGYAAVAGG